MVFKRLLGSITAVIILAMPMASCARPADPADSSGEPSASESAVYRIGVSPLTTQLEYYIAYLESIQTAAREKGVEVNIVDSKWDIAKQQSDIRQFVGEGMDAIICSPTNPEQIRPQLMAAQKAGIPVVVEMTYVQDVYPLVGTNQYEGGKLAGEYAGNWINQRYGGQCDVAIVDSPYFQNIIDRVGGFKAGLMEVCPAAKIVAVVDGQAKMEAASKATEEVLTKYPNIRCVFGINDDTAKGANAAFHAHAPALKTEDICIIGFDADKSCRKLIGDDEYIKASVAANTDVIGSVCIDTALNLITGKDVPQWVEVKGAQFLVSKENISQYLSDIGS